MMNMLYETKASMYIRVPDTETRYSFLCRVDDSKLIERNESKNVDRKLENMRLF